MTNKKNILVVDDNQINFKVVSSFLKDQNYNIEYAINGFEALNILQNLQIDLIIMDVLMPQMDGFETTKKIKSDEKYKDIPIIFLTAKTQTKDIIEGFHAGAVDYITKPFNGDELIMRVKNHLELSEAKQTIIKFQKTRDRLYSILAHDIRSPLTSITMLLDGLSGNYIDPNSSGFKSIVSTISLSTKNTLTLIQNILEWTKIQSYDIALFVESVDLQMVIDKTISLLMMNLQEKNLKVFCHIPPNTFMFVDEITVSNIFRNLIANAIKFTKPGGEITISSEESSEFVHITIQDTGIGMSSEIIEKIFDKDEHFTCRGTNNEPGTGLGLYMVKDFVKLNKGTLKVESEIDYGTKFTISFPKNKQKFYKS